MHNASIRRTSTLVGVLIAIGAVAAVFSNVASATYPGKNGKIAFLHGSNLVTANADGSSRKAILDGNGNFTDASFSPNGRRVVVGGYKGLTLAKADGTQREKIPHTASGAFSASFSPLGRKIAYSANRKTKLIRLDGSHRRIATDTFGLNVTYSPRGRYLVLGLCDIERINLSTGKTKTLYEATGEGVCAVSPDVSPNGKHVVFERAYDGDDEVWTVGIDGKNAHPLIRGFNLQGGDPVYSPNGKKILVTAKRRQWDETRLMTANAKTGKQRHMLGSFTGSAPTWAPRAK